MPHTKPGFFTRLTALYRLVVRAYGQYRLEIILLTVLGFASGILEGIGVNALIPLLSFIVPDGVGATDTISQFTRAAFAFLHIDFAPKFLLYFIVILFLSKAAIGIILDFIRIKIAAEYERETRANLFSAQLRSSWPHLLKQRLGHLETLLLVDVPSARELLIKLSMSIVLVTSLIMYAVVVFNVSTVITLVTVVVGVLFLYIVRPFAIRIRRYSAERSRFQRDTAHFVGEHLQGAKTVKSSAVEETVIARGLRLFHELKTRAVGMEMLQALVLELVPPLAILYIASIFGLSFRYNIVTLAALPTIVYLIYRIFSYVQQLQSAVQTINVSIPYLENVLKYEDQAREKSEQATGVAPFVFKDSLRFNDTHFAYENGSDVLKGINFSIPHGAMIGIIGPSGAGKTTSVDLLLRLLTPTSGTITVDGVDSRTIQLSAWREKVAYVSQDLFLIHDTIRKNIQFYDPSITDEEIWQAAKMAHIADFIHSRPEGLDTHVGERGIELSAGQRQRLVIARALARKPEVLILDEATSALDTESEVQIQKMLQELKGAITIIVIAHRLSTIMHSDSLIIIENGRITEQGAPKELLKDSDSYFYKVSTIT